MKLVSGIRAVCAKVVVVVLVQLSPTLAYTPGRRMPFLISFYCTLKKFRVSQG